MKEGLEERKFTGSLARSIIFSIVILILMMEIVTGIIGYIEFTVVLGEQYNVDLPLTNAVYELCYGESELSYRERCEEMLAKLFARDTKSEFYS